MISLLTLSIGIGLLIGLVFVEVFGLFAGGMVVPGYLALDLAYPGTVALTLACAIFINLFIRLLSAKLIIYGRRRVSLTMLIAFLVGVMVRQVFSSYLVVNALGGEIFSVIGYIIPGLIALSIDRQGLLETITTLLTISVAVRLCLIIIIGPLLIS